MLIVFNMSSNAGSSMNDSRLGSKRDRSFPGADALVNDNLEPIQFYGILDGGGGSHPLNASNLPSAPSSKDSSNLDTNRQGVLSNQCILRSPLRDSASVRSDIAFGDGDGTLGFVNESGELICIVQMLDMGPTGLFRARPNYRIPPPTDSLSNLPQTNHPFFDIIQRRKYGLGINLVRDELFQDGSHQIDFVHDRWPRFSSQYQKLDVETQIFIKDNRVIQHYVLRSKDQISVKFAFNAAITIDDPYMSSELKGACNIIGGTFSTGGAAVALAGGAGGHVQFFASLFKDAQPITLNLSVEEILSPDYDDLPSSDYFQINEPRGKNNYKWASWLRHDEEIAMLEGETRTITGIYHLDSQSWSRDDLYSLQLIPEHDNINHRMKEEQFMKDYEAAKTLSPEASEQFVFDQSKIFIEQKEDATFSNWGGQATSSQRLFGVEWRKGEPEDLLPYEMQVAFEERFSEIRRDIGQNYGKLALSK